VSGAATSYVTARFLTPDYYVQGRDTALSCPLWLNGALVAPTEAGSTVSIYDASNTAIVSGAAVSVVGSVATYTLAGATTSSRSRGMGFRTEWSLIRSGVPTTYRNAAGLIRCELAPVIADADLYRRESGLNPSGAAPLSRQLTTYQDYRDEAWITIHGRLSARGSLPHLIMEPTALREPHLFLTLHLVFEDFRSRLGNEAWQQKSADYLARFDKAWADLRFEYDTTDSGQSDGRRKRSANPSVWFL
jgi:hypothetical protein